MSLNIFTNKKRNFLLAVILTASFLFVNRTYAAQSIDLFDVDLATYEWQDNTHFTPQEVDFTDTGCISTITLLFDQTYDNTALNIIIASTTKNPSTFGITWTGHVTSTGPTATTTYHTFFASSTAVTGTNNRPWCHTSNQRQWFITPNNIHYMTSESSSTYTNVSYWADLGYSLNTYTFGTPAQNRDIWINFDGFSESGSSIDFSPRPTSTCAFGSWQIEYNLSQALYNTFASTTLIGAGSIVIGLNQGIPGDNIGGYLFSRRLGPALEPGIHTNWVPEPSLLATGSVYYARAYMCDSFGSGDCSPNYDNPHLVVQSPEYEFIIPDETLCTTTWAWQGQKDYNILVTSTYQSLLNEALSTCNTIDGSITSSLCKALAYIFVPSNDILTNFADLRNKVANKPPFGYFPVYSAQINSLLNGSSTTTLTTSTVFDMSTTLSGLSQISLIQTLKTIFGWFLWIVFAFYLYKRFKYFSLHG